MATPSDLSATETSSSPKVTRPKVIYVMGRGKSGSTILGLTLGNCEDVFFGGELCTWLITSGKPVFGGEERKRFWGEVLEDVDPKGMFGSRAFHHLERALAAFRVDRWPARRRLRKPFEQVTEDLYRSIADRAGTTWVVDTSHMPMRARELQRMDGIDLYLLFLVRDTESVVASYMRHVKHEDDASERRRRFFTMNSHMWVTYLLSVVVFLRQSKDRRLLVHHEDFIASPKAVLREILDFAGCPAELPDLNELRTGIALKGNALLRSQTIALKSKPAPPYRRSRLMRLIQRPWALILARLRPVATGAGAHEHAIASDAGK